MATGRKLMILAKGATKAAGVHKAKADGDWEVWTLNDMALHDLNPVHFELHQWTPQYAEWMMAKNDLRKFGTVYMIKPVPELPNSVEFPLAEVVNTHNSNYLGNTIALQLALALYQHKQGRYIGTLALYGVDYITQATLDIEMARDPECMKAISEWTDKDRDTFRMGTVEANYGRACTEYWLGRMAECGISFVVHAQSELFTTSPGWGRHIYGYEGNIVDGKGHA
jgi:hypothetical protein